MTGRDTEQLDPADCLGSLQMMVGFYSWKSEGRVLEPL